MKMNVRVVRIIRAVPSMQFNVDRITKLIVADLADMSLPTGKRPHSGSVSGANRLFVFGVSYRPKKLSSKLLS